MKKPTQKKILFFGLGSIGKKHAKIIRDKFGFELYAFRTGKGQEKNNPGIKEFHNLDDAFAVKPDVAFITNPTALHMPAALECAKRGIALFIEKPISNSLDNTPELEVEIKKRKLFSFVAYNLRFHPVIEYLKKIVEKNGAPIYFRATCSSYLPNWRPEQDYSKSYSAIKENGGGVILDLSHEFDYAAWLFGGIKKIDGVCGKASNLKIDSEDFAEARVVCGNGTTGSIHLDYFGLQSARKIQIYYNDRYVEGDLLQNTIKILEKEGKEKKMQFDKTIEDTFEKQIDYFFDNFEKGNKEIMNRLPEALKTFSKIIEFRKQCRRGKK